MDWQPIETAPKDGTPVLTSDGGMIYSSHFDGEWMIFNAECEKYFWYPKYWMKMPDLPRGRL